MCYYLKPFLCMMHLRMNGPLITGQTKRTCFGLISLLPFKACDFTVNEFSQSMFSFSCIFRKKVFLVTNNLYMSNTDNLYPIEKSTLPAAICKTRNEESRNGMRNTKTRIVKAEICKTRNCKSRNL